jgi:hypothetical protein
MRRSMIAMMTAVLAICLALGSAVAKPKPAGELPADVFTEVAPFPDRVIAAGWSAINLELEARLEAWGALVGVTTLSDDELAAGIDEISTAIAFRDVPPNGEEDPQDVLRLIEWFERRQLLCVNLSADHAYRGGEYCK